MNIDLAKLKTLAPNIKRRFGWLGFIEGSSDIKTIATEVNKHVSFATPTNGKDPGKGSRLGSAIKRLFADTDPVGSVIWRYAGHGMGRTWNDSFLEHQYITGRTPSATVRRNAVCTDGTGLLGSPSIGGRNRSAQSL